MIALFLAGGSGTRLWPLSRENNPKQLHKLVSDKSLMTETVERVAPLIKPENIWIVTNADYVGRIAVDSPGVPKEQIIAEPFPLGTNLAVGLGAIHIERRHPDAVIAIGWADAYIGNQGEFRRALTEAAEIAPDVDGVILSIIPAYPSTGHGYLKMGKPIPAHDGSFEIARFEEKPAADRAEEFVQSGDYYWNTGISIWKVATLLELMSYHKPEHYAALRYVSEAIGTPDERARMEAAFAGLDRMAIDHAIFEKATRMATIPVDLDWNDIGSWSAIHDVLSTGDDNVTRGSVVSVDTNNCLIYGQKRLIATLGISDLVIVETEDAILVAHKDDADRIKELYTKVKNFGGAKYL